jgi:hypothetical protein
LPLFFFFPIFARRLEVRISRDRRSSGLLTRSHHFHAILDEPLSARRSRFSRITFRWSAPARA